MAKRGLLTDQALGEGKTFASDGLGFATYSDVLAVAAVESEGPITIGVFGEWGTGKTSLMHMMENRLKSRKKVVTVWFNAWRYESDEHPVVSLVATIVKALRDNKGWRDAIKDGGHAFLQALQAVAYGFSMKTEISLLGAGKVEGSFSGKDIIDRIDKMTNEELMDTSVLYSMFERLDALELPGGHRVVVFIDDLDRCFPDQSVKLLESIKLVLNQTGFVYVIGASRSILEAYVQFHYGKEFGIIGFPGASYLDKLVQLPFHIPPHSGRMSEYCKALMKAMDVTVGAKLEHILPVIGTALGSNPRAVIRFVNNVLVDLSIYDALRQDTVLEEVQIESFAIARCLQQRWPDVFNRLAVSDELCEKVAIWKSSELSTLIKSADTETDAELMFMSKTLFSNRELCQLLIETEEGIGWLKDRGARGGAIHFLQTQRRTTVMADVRAANSFDIQFCYVAADVKYVTTIAEYLVDNGVTVNMDEAADVRLCRAIGLCIGGVDANMDAVTDAAIRAVAARSEDREFLIIPVLLPNSSVERIPEPIRQFSSLDLREGIDALALASLVRQLQSRRMS